MKRLRGLFYNICLVGLFFPPYFLYADTAQKTSNSSVLEWVSDPANPYNRCGGYYLDQPIVYTPNPYLASQGSNYDISADQTVLKLKGVTTAKGNVRMTRPDEEMQSNLAYLYPNDETHQIDLIKMFGSLRYRRSGELIAADNGTFDISSNHFILNRCEYRMALKEDSRKTVAMQDDTGKITGTKFYQLTAQGAADQIEQVRKGLIYFKNATYTTCSPLHNDWLFKATQLKLHTDTGRGETYNTRLLVKGVPVLYTPYFNFPIDKRRQTGFLYPTFGSSATSGLTFSAPYYLNLAPNYDATITPTVMTKRGTMGTGLFRFLTTEQTGAIDVSALPHDRVFGQFQDTAAAKYQGQPALHRLLDASTNRLAFSEQDQIKLNDHWNGNVNYNYASDDYYLQDFGNGFLGVNNYQLLRQAQTTYSGEYWNFLGNFQGYQALHPITEGIMNNTYARLPQLRLTGANNELPLGVNASVETEYDRFMENRTPGVAAIPPLGYRTNVNPALSWSKRWSFAYLDPRMQVQDVEYRSNNINPNENNYAWQGFGVPMFDMNSGLEFERSGSFLNYDYRETLEPQLYYLYVPYHNQNGLPVFDTTANVFNYNMLFVPNRFSGVDRVGDANQVSTAISTNFLDENTGDQKANFGVGEIRYFRDRLVGLCANHACSALAPIDRRVTSPLAGMATYNFNPAWLATAGETWDGHDGFNNETLGVKYQPDVDHIIGLNYQYIKGGDDILPGVNDPNNPRNNLEQTDIASVWRLTDRWSVLGRWNYNWSHDNLMAVYGGVGYESCCWAMRVIGGRVYTGESPYNINRSFNDYRYRYDNQFYVQFVLKGLGSFGEGGDPSSLFSQTLGGYVDQFGVDN